MVNLAPNDTIAEQLTKWLAAIQALEEAIFANPTPPTLTMPAMLALFSDWCKSSLSYLNQCSKHSIIFRCYPLPAQRIIIMCYG